MANANEGGNDPKKDSDVEAVLNELEKEGAEIEGRKKPDTPKEEPEEKPKPDNKPEPKSTEEQEEEDADDIDEDEDEKSSRRVKMMPAWKHEVALKSIEKKHQEEIESLKSSLTKGKAEETPVPDDKIKALAEKWNADENFIKDIVSIHGFKLPKDVEDKLAKLETLEKKIQEDADQSTFNKEYDKNVLPLIQQEYPILSQKQLDRVKKRVEAIAFTEDYARTPLQVIYKGLDEFRGLAKPSKKTAEAGTGGGGQKQLDITEADFESMSEEDAQKLSDADFDKYLEWRRKNK